MNRLNNSQKSLRSQIQWSMFATLKITY